MKQETFRIIFNGDLEDPLNSEFTATRAAAIRSFRAWDTVELHRIYKYQSIELTRADGTRVEFVDYMNA